jgi:hypothetical protein
MDADQRELRSYIAKIFKESRNAWNKPDSLAHFTQLEIDTFIYVYNTEFENTLDIVNKTGFDYATRFFYTPIGWRILILKTVTAMKEELNDLGQDFIDHNMQEIESAAYKMVDAYRQDEESDDLYNMPQLDWYREFLYENIERPYEGMVN